MLRVFDARKAELNLDEKDRLSWATTQSKRLRTMLAHVVAARPKPQPAAWVRLLGLPSMKVEPKTEPMAETTVDAETTAERPKDRHLFRNNVDFGF